MSNDTKSTPLDSNSVPSDPPPSYESAAHPALQAGAGGPGRPRGPLPLDLPALKALRGKRVILASKSPRRKQLLAQIGLKDIECIPSDFAENLPKSSMSPFEYVLQTAIEKCNSVYAKEMDNTELGEPALVIAADTVVVSMTGRIMEKPRSEQDHINMLKSLRDSGTHGIDKGTHKVLTAVVVMRPLESLRDPGYRQQTFVEETTVKFDDEVTDDLILAYVRTREGADKAGGYGIQGIGTVLVESIEGSFDNVVGLPVRRTLKYIESVMRSEDDMMDDGLLEDGE
ncbi:Maf-domain-containing protein [Pseudovirgaria hyperparasitica]|uniref:Maf-domain-containing protein n=1 Tax=Pseudovirgaria hyperparasitica TaxID=470096 RepID=A0A6A6WCG6_9PEZI|nr:Maf-domain-containing protein [Pseudovirgaria hyperparasitica]KAF2758801.1 Maf-domain-containing protein [Pseudovirgaria hyperparasitica]